MRSSHAHPAHGTRTAMRIGNALRDRRGRADKEEVARYTPNPIVPSLRGTLDGIVLRRDGVALALPEFRNPRTPLQNETRRRLDFVTNAWENLTPEEALGWRRYADAMKARGATSESGKPLRPYDFFCGLGCKFLQIHGGTTFPMAAPDRPFLGDALAVVAEPTPRGVLYRSNGPNGPFALTEPLLQPLRHAAIEPQRDRYRTQAFVAFLPDALTVEIPAKPGAYAAAVRFVLGTSGQASRLVPLGVVVVQATS